MRPFNWWTSSIPARTNTATKEPVMRIQTKCELYARSKVLTSQGSWKRKVWEPQIFMLKGINAVRVDLTFALSTPQRFHNNLTECGNETEDQMRSLCSKYWSTLPSQGACQREVWGARRVIQRRNDPRRSSSNCPSNSPANGIRTAGKGLGWILPLAWGWWQGNALKACQEPWEAKAMGTIDGKQFMPKL